MTKIKRLNRTQLMDIAKIIRNTSMNNEIRITLSNSIAQYLLLHDSLFDATRFKKIATGKIDVDNRTEAWSMFNLGDYNDPSI